MQFQAFGILLAKSTLLMTLLQGCRCHSTMCQEPSRPLNGHVLYRSRGSSYVIYKCNPGYVLIGSRASRCILGRWSPDTPKCVRADKQDSPPRPEIEGYGFDNDEQPNYEQEYLFPVENGYVGSEKGYKDRSPPPEIEGSGFDSGEQLSYDQEYLLPVERGTCPAGYTRSENGCKDINECAVKNGGCQRLCKNTIGSFRCLCGIWGYDLAPDGKTCIPLPGIQAAAIQLAEDAARGHGFLTAV